MTYLDKNGLQAVTNKLVQGEAIKVVSSKGHNVKDVIDNIKNDCNDIKNPFSYKIENKVSNFHINTSRSFYPPRVLSRGSVVKLENICV